MNVIVTKETKLNKMEIRYCKKRENLIKIKTKVFSIVTIINVANGIRTIVKTQSLKITVIFRSSAHCSHYGNC